MLIVNHLAARSVFSVPMNKKSSNWLNFTPVKIKYCILFFLAFLFLSSTVDWGFFGHRRINKLACFTLPQDLFGFYKSNIDYISDHAVDPDKRRYASKFEAIRHYIDLDIWGEAPFNNIPRDWVNLMMHYTTIKKISTKGDTVNWLNRNLLPYDLSNPAETFTFKDKEIDYRSYRSFIYDNVLNTYYDDDRDISKKEMEAYFGKFGIEVKGKRFIAVDEFTEHGIVPFHLSFMQKRLEKAFLAKDIPSILRLSAEMGHYLGDAHVPLHTTENYNGQLTDQLGIHGFWESRIPELFADNEYDYFVGKANYIEDKEDFFWDVVLDSHALVDSVLLIEKNLSETFPQDQQICYDDRGNQLTRTQCKEYAKAYSLRMNGMVEERMREAILAIGSVWYTAWVDAGQPQLSNLGVDEDVLTTEDDSKVDNAFKSSKIKGRDH